MTTCEHIPTEEKKYVGTKFLFSLEEKFNY